MPLSRSINYTLPVVKIFAADSGPVGLLSVQYSDLLWFYRPCKQILRLPKNNGGKFGRLAIGDWQATTVCPRRGVREVPRDVYRRGTDTLHRQSRLSKVRCVDTPRTIFSWVVLRTSRHLFPRRCNFVVKSYPVDTTAYDFVSDMTVWDVKVMVRKPLGYEVTLVIATQ